MERGLRAPLSPREEVSFRRVALGIWKAKLLPARDVERLKALSLIEEHESHLRLTPRERPLVGLELDADAQGLAEPLGVRAGSGRSPLC
jgi:hypothetical protein